MTELDVTKAEIKAYVLEHTGLKVSYLYIAQVKDRHGIIERDCYDKPQTEGIVCRSVLRRRKRPLRTRCGISR